MALKKNVIANYLSQGITALMGIAFLPIYIKHLGAEAYGLVGIYVFMQAWLGLLDFGMASTLNREFARHLGMGQPIAPLRDLLRTLECMCLTIAIVFGIGVALAANWIARSWVNTATLNPSTVALAISVMGMVIASRMMEGLYRGAIAGMQSLVWLSAVSAAIASLRWGGAAWIVVEFDADIVDFFVWQVMASLLSLGLMAFKVHHSLPGNFLSSRFSLEQLRTVHRFAAGMMAGTALSLVLTQADKILLSKMLSLEAFGYYALAGTVAGGLYQLTAPITQAYYPRLTELLAKQNFAAVATTYHQGAQLVSVMAIPTALVLAFFAESLMSLWTGDPALARQVGPTLGLLALGTMLNALMHIPHALSLAYGWPGFLARLNTVAVVILLPAIWVVTPTYGALGAAWLWLLLNSGYVILGIQYLHRHVMPQEKWLWYIHDIAKPALAALITVTGCRWAHETLAMSRPHWLWILGSALLAFAAAAAAAPATRNQLLALAHGFGRHPH